MKDLITLKDVTKNDLFEIFNRTDYFLEHPYEKRFINKCFILFFPESSIRTRVTFERGINDLGGKCILFDSDVLKKKESLIDVMGYLDNWVDGIIVRFGDIEIIEKIAKYSKHSVINGLSNINHPCEVISDLYSLYKKDKKFLDYNYLYVGPDSNIGYAWKEAEDSFGISFMQCCPEKYAIKGAHTITELQSAVEFADVIITDSLSRNMLSDFKQYQITKDVLNWSNKKIYFNPCPPFFRGEEVSKDAMESSAFAGYEFKKSLLNVQQAIIDFCIN